MVLLTRGKDIDLFSDKVYWQVTSFPRMKSPNSIDFIMGDLVGKRSILQIVIIVDAMERRQDREEETYRSRSGHRRARLLQSLQTLLCGGCCGRSCRKYGRRFKMEILF